VFIPVVVRLAKSPTVANDRGVSAKRTSPWQAIQRNYPGSLLSFGSGSAINRTTSGLQPPPLTVSCQRFNLVARPSLLRQSQKEYCFALVAASASLTTLAGIKRLIVTHLVLHKWIVL
jgi:hypothetical protein